MIGFQIRTFIVISNNVPYAFFKSLGLQKLAEFLGHISESLGLENQLYQDAAFVSSLAKYQTYEAET